MMNLSVRSSLSQVGCRIGSGLPAIAAVATVLIFGSSAFAIHDKTNLGRWDKPGGDPPDKVCPGYLINLGPTGGRAVLTERTFNVHFVFKGSPAYGKLKVGDVITGVYGKPFAKAHIGQSPHGYEGPIMDFGNAIEKAESSDGKLLLNVTRAGKNIDVTVPLEPIGAFGPDYPNHDKKSRLIRERALQYLVDHRNEDQRGQCHTRCAVALALLTGDTPAERAMGRSMALQWSRQSPNAETWSWPLSYQCITLSEYYLLTKDPAVLPMIRTDVRYIQNAEWKGPNIRRWTASKFKNADQATVDRHQALYDGGFGHCPYPVVVRRAGGPGKYGGGGYGPMQYTTILTVIARQLAARCGVPVDADLLKRSMVFIHHGTNAAGYVAYGGEFTMNNGPVDPVRWKASTRGDDYAGRAGCSIIGHLLSPEYPSSAHYLKLNCKYFQHAYKSMPDGHAEINLGIFWGILGTAASHDHTLFRTVMDYHKAFFNMMRCYDGSFTLLPGRNYADGGYYNSSRFHPTATMALAYGLCYPKLRIEGVEVQIPGVNPVALTGQMAAAYRALVHKDYRQAYGALYRPRAQDANTAQAMRDFIDAKWQEQVAGLEPIEKSGDILSLRNEVMQLQKQFMGIKGFDDKIRPYLERLAKDPWRKEVSTGQAYLSYLGVLQKYKSQSAVKKLRQFAQANPESIYGKWAAAVVKEFTASGTISVSSAGRPFDAEP